MALFSREAARRLPYYHHEPQQIDAFYRIAILKAPADYQSYLLYSYYLASKGCCSEKITSLLAQAERRCPSCVERYNRWQNHFLELGDLSRALPYYRRTLDLDPDSAQKIYRLLEQHGCAISTLEEVTPMNTGPLLQLCAYLAGEGDCGKASLNRILDKLDAMPLDSEQRLNVAAFELHTGAVALAKKQANRAAAMQEDRLRALQLLAEIAWHQQEWTELEKLSKQIETLQLQAGDPNASAQTALLMIARFASVENKQTTKKRLLRVLDEYPRCAPCYFQVANSVQDESHQLAVYYLRKAIESDPENPEYLNRLAQQFLMASEIEDAEQTYQRLILNPDWRDRAYLGLSECKVTQGDKLEAIAILQEGILKSKQAGELYFRLATILDSVGEYQKAAVAYKEYNQLTSGTVDGYNLAGDAFRKAGDYLAAKEQYQTVLTLDPNNTHARDQLSLLD